ncbi:MAG: hypothetical protein R3B96_19680 [Pirellulaceae bacterium]
MYHSNHLTETVAPGAAGQIKAQFNTRSFLGQRGATVTVVFDRPRYGEAQLRVDGYVRRDVVCNPGELDFGSVRCGVAEEKRIEINYAGRDDWKIESVSSTIPGARRQHGRNSSCQRPSHVCPDRHVDHFGEWFRERRNRTPDQ